ncbi:hypothetical protein VNO80_24898 [Phaseolus coccineus]|uniref:Uncharacterized protein n=1 Tax=Phaseolus coccineus TaxID=3886 RepID=A0AAN9QNG7_PHACN
MQNVQNITFGMFKYLLVYKGDALEDLLVCRPDQGQQLDALHGGFDKLLTRSLSEFFECKLAKISLDLVCNAVSTELRAVRQDNYGWILHSWTTISGSSKQESNKAGDVVLSPRAKGSSGEFISDHREALEPDFLRNFASLDRPYFWI